MHKLAKILNNLGLAYTIGTEQGKGTPNIAKTHEYLSKLDGIINYAGIIEAFNYLMVI